MSAPDSALVAQEQFQFRICVETAFSSHSRSSAELWGRSAISSPRARRSPAAAPLALHRATPRGGARVECEDCRATSASSTKWQAAPGVIRQRCGFKGQAAELENACAYKSPSKQVISM